MSSDDQPTPSPSVLEALRAGRLEGLEECYRLFGARVYRICRGLLPQSVDAEDATQEVFMKVLDRIGQFEGRAKFSTWLHRIAVNHCLHQIEKARDLEESLIDPGLSPVEASTVAEDADRIAELLRRLPAKQRTVMVLREVEELSCAEIARTLDIPEGTVLSRLARGRERLATWLTQKDKEGVSDSRYAS